MKKAWTALKEIEQRISKVAEIIRSAPNDKMHRHAADPMAARSRELTTILVQPVAVSIATVPDLTDRQATFYNGDVDELVIDRLAAYVGLPGQLPMLGRTSDGFTFEAFSEVTDTEDLAYPIALFDFLWTYEVSSRGSIYSRNEFVSSDSLMGLGDRGSPMEFRVPLRIPRGESVVFKVRPLFIDFRRQAALAGDGFHSFNVVFVGLGHRRG